MTDIVAFISARLDDDQAYALEAAKEFGPDWIEIWSGQIDLSANLPDRQPPAGRHWDTHVQTNDSRVSRHMVRHDPARVLREVAAKRRVLERHCRDEWHTVSTRKALGIYVCEGCNSYYQGSDSVTEDINDCPELRDMASVYAEHPDFDPAWAVDVGE